MLPAAAIPSLVDPVTGCFCGRQAALEATTNHWSPAEVEAEIEAQLSRFRELSGGIDPRHIDGHNHVHVLPVVREALAAVLTRRHGRYYIRPFREPPMGTVAGSFSPYLCGVATHAESAIALLSAHGLALQGLVGLRLMGRDLTRRRLVEALVSARNAGANDPADAPTVFVVFDAVHSLFSLLFFRDNPV